MPHIVDRLPLKSSAPGTERFLTVHRFGSSGSGPKIYLQAALHADEWPGLMALNHLIPLLAQADADGRITGEIVLVPYANPIGLDQRMGSAAPGRYAYDGSGNFNRNWPDLSAPAAEYLDGPFTGNAQADIANLRQALRKAVADMPARTDVEHWRRMLLSLSIDADAVIDVHCDQESYAHVYCHVAHAEIARTMAATVDFPIILLEEEAGGFSFDDCNAGVWRRMTDHVEGGETLPMACFGCTLELRGKDDVSDALGRRDAEGLLRFLMTQGAVSGDPGPVEGPDPYRLDAVDVMHTDTAGLIAYNAEIGDIVEEGQVIAEIIDLTAPDPLTARTPIHTRTAGLFFARSDLRLVPPGEGIGKVAGRTPLAHRKKGALLES